MDNATLIGVLALVTLVIVVGVLLFQRARLRQSKARPGDVTGDPSAINRNPGDINRAS